MGGFARFDASRAGRTGVPEIILAEGKSDEQIVGVLRELHGRARGALVSRLNARQRHRLEQEAERGLPLDFLAGGRVARLSGSLEVPSAKRSVALLTAGTSDVAVAEEARAVLEALGVRTVVAYDVGVAGLHRLLRALRRIRARRPAAYLVFAGREGALPTVVAGLVRGPVIGIPTSHGYGRGGRGEAALSAMLQSCAPVAVMNIDAAVPAALFAAQLAAAD